MGGFGDVTGVDFAGLVGAGGEKPDAAVVAEIAASVDEEVDEVFVAGAVPEEDNVAKLICVLIKQVLPDVVLDGL